MADENVQAQLERAAKLTPRAAKTALLRLIDPTLPDNKAATLAGYSRGQGGQVKTRIQGALGGFLEDKGITVETIAQKLYECLNAKKYAPRNERTYDEKGRPVSDKAVKVDLGPDWAAILRATQTLILLAGFADKNRPAQLPPPKPEEIPQDELEAAAGRGPQIVDAEYTDVQTG